MVTKEVESVQERSDYSEDIHFCDSCGNPVEKPVNYYAERDIPNVELAVKRKLRKAEQKIKQDIEDRVNTQTHKYVHGTTKGKLEVPDFQRVEVKEQLSPEEVKEEALSAVTSQTREMRKDLNYLSPDPTYQFCPDCRDGVENNTHFLNTYLNGQIEEPDTEDNETSYEKRFEFLTIALFVGGVMCGIYGIGPGDTLITGIVILIYFLTGMALANHEF